MKGTREHRLPWGTLSYATTFGTPWGRCRWLRMPFGISPAPEEFQQRLDQTLAGLNGFKAIADNILVFGCGANDDKAVKDHDEKLIALLQSWLEKGVKLNRGKLQLRLKEVAYMGFNLTLKKSRQSIREMPAATDK